MPDPKPSSRKLKNPKPKTRKELFELKRKNAKTRALNSNTPKNEPTGSRMSKVKGTVPRKKVKPVSKIKSKSAVKANIVPTASTVIPKPKATTPKKTIKKGIKKVVKKVTAAVKNIPTVVRQKKGKRLQKKVQEFNSKARKNS